MEVYPEEPSEDFHPAECNEDAVYPTEQREGVYPEERSEDFHPAECNEDAVYPTEQSEGAEAD